MSLRTFSFIVPVVEFISFKAELKDEREKRRLPFIVELSPIIEFFKIEIGAPRLSRLPSLAFLELGLLLTSFFVTIFLNVRTESTLLFKRVTVVLRDTRGEPEGDGEDNGERDTLGD